MVTEHSNRSRAERFIEQINADNAKRLALLLVISFAAYHGMLHLRYGIDSCKWLLSDGRYKGDQEWQPYGCMIHHYSQTDTRRCLRYLAFWGVQSHFVFIGDTRIRELYIGFIRHLQLRTDETSTELPKNKYDNLTFVDVELKIKVEFVWNPTIDIKMYEMFRNWQKNPKPPSILVAGSALHTIHLFNATPDALNSYTFNLTRLVQPIDNLHEKKCRVLWALQGPIYKEKLKPGFDMITNEQIDLYNKAAIEVLRYSHTDIWRSERLVAQGMLSKSPDGIHLAQRPLKHNIQILLNMYCNDYMNFNDGTCCSSAESYTTLQIVTFAILGVCVIISIVMVLHRWVLKWRGTPHRGYTFLSDPDRPEMVASVPPSDLYTLFTSLAKIALIMGYFFVCDRTNFFMKENKYYSEFSFWLPVGYMCALGLFFTEDSRFTKVLHRDQTEEWKGWMQLVILIYHMTGASRVLPIYMHIRVLISAYIFLSGYGHFCYAWQIGDFGLVRFFQVLFRLNFMTVTLCLCMNRPYQFYYFVPLLSFWFVMIYIVLSLPPHITSQSSDSNPLQYLYLVLKFVALFSVVTILYMSEVFFEKVFVTRPWKALFVTTDDDIHEWWSRWKLDRYSILFGMVFAVAYMLSQKYNFLDDNNHSNLFSRGIALSATLVALIGMGSYTTFTFLCRNQLECNEIHSYIVFLPIISYIVLRNISGILRTRYSSFFAWFGRISLELFISQYHIWLAADTHGVLVLIPSYPVLNVMVTSFIFVCASHEVHRLTQVLLPYAVPSDWKLVLRNFMLFLAVLVPIGINDGMF